MPRVLIAVALLAACAVAAWLFLRPNTPERLSWQGYAEADFVKVGPTQQGLLTLLHVARGDPVKQGDALFEQDDRDDRAAAAQAQSVLRQAREQLDNLSNPLKPSEIAAAQANLREAQAVRNKMQADLDRNLILLKTGAATSQTVHDQQQDLLSATAKMASMQAQLDQAQSSLGRPGEIAAQTAAVEAAEAALTRAQWRLSQRAVVAPVAGVVADVMARPGETLAAGAPVVSLLPPENIFLRFFVPEPELSRLHLGDALAVSCENCPPDTTAILSFVSPKAEYTPPFIYSESTRSKFVFLAQATPSNPARLNPGQPVTLSPRAAK